LQEECDCKLYTPSRGAYDLSNVFYFQNILRYMCTCNLIINH